MVDFARFGGAFVALGGVLWSAAALAGWTGQEGASSALYPVAALVLLAGMYGFYRRSAGGMGGAGQAGFVQSFIGLGMLTAGLVGELIPAVASAAAQVTSFGFLISGLGLILLGYSAIYNEPLPRWNFLPLVVAIFIPLDILFGGLSAAVSPLLAVGFGGAWVVLGYLLWGAPEAPARSKPPSSTSR